MTTFSQLVDGIVAETLRPDQLTSIVTYTNQTIREVHTRPATNIPILFDANREELELTVNADPFIWSLPSVTRFQKLEAAYVPELEIYIEQRSPRIIRNFSFEPYSELGYYRTADTYAFMGVEIGFHLWLSYFQFPRTLAYQPKPRVEYDPVTDSYKQPNGSDATPAQLELCTNWVLQRWADTIREGVRAKVWKRLSDDSRTRMAYSAYTSAQTGLWNTEPAS